MWSELAHSPEGGWVELRGPKLWPLAPAPNLAIQAGSGGSSGGRQTGAPPGEGLRLRVLQHQQHPWHSHRWVCLHLIGWEVPPAAPQGGDPAPWEEPSQDWVLGCGGGQAFQVAWGFMSPQPPVEAESGSPEGEAAPGRQSQANSLPA